ncbi:Lysophospholipid acyltransferase 1 [Homalodisca vitripennis]|nr:Lysophospholipid acyltransferase 1 [Homalodisca vitripennis]
MVTAAKQCKYHRGKKSVEQASTRSALHSSAIQTEEALPPLLQMTSRPLRIARPGPEYAEMYFVFAFCNGNANVAEREYTVPPVRLVASTQQVLTKLHQRLVQHGSVHKEPSESGAAALDDRWDLTFFREVTIFSDFFPNVRQAVHLAGLPALCYLIIRTQDPQTMQRLVLVVSMFYLSCIHIHRQIYDYGSLSLDVTGPLMVIVQKVTSLACSLNDGLTYKEDDLSANQRYYAVSKIPSVLEYFAYIFHFHVLMAGPVVFYKDYIEFVNGHNILKHSSGIDSLREANTREGQSDQLTFHGREL